MREVSRHPRGASWHHRRHQSCLMHAAPQGRRLRFRGGWVMVALSNDDSTEMCLHRAASSMPSEAAASSSMFCAHAHSPAAHARSAAQSCLAVVVASLEWPTLLRKNHRRSTSSSATLGRMC